jgi:hypothetical protein
MLKLFLHFGLHHNCHLHTHSEGGNSRICQNVRTTSTYDVTESQKLNLFKGRYAIYNV